MEYSTSSLLVSNSVMLILYSLIIPFWAVRGGGDQVRERDDELIAVTFNSSGGLLGAIQ